MRHKKIVISASTVTTGGLGSYLVTLAGGLASSGWSVYLLTTNERGDFYEKLQESITCHDLSGIPLSRKKVIATANLVNEIAPEILLLNHVPLLHYALPLLRSDIKTVAVLHSDDPRFYRTAAIFRGRVFRWIAPTAGVAQKIAALVGGENIGRISVIPHGVNTAVFFPEPSRPTASGKIAFVGHVAKNKGADLLPEIIHRVAKEHPAAHLTVVGHGPLSGEVARRFREAGLGDRLSLFGVVSHEEVAAILRRSDILLLPTRVEGFGLAIAEAMLCGAVPVVTRLRGVTDHLVEDGGSGFLVEQDDAAGFAGAICAILDDTGHFKALSTCAARKAHARFSHDRMIKAYKRTFAGPDIRPMKERRTAAGWLAELLPEVIRGEAVSGLIRKGRYLFR